jgi:hypothetical protein
MKILFLENEQSLIYKLAVKKHPTLHVPGSMNVDTRR